MTIKTKQFSNEERIEFWKNHYKLWEESSLSQAEYCRQNNLNKQLFSKWKNKISNNSENMKLVEIPISNLAIETLGNEMELIINDSVKIKLNINYNEELLQKILKTFGVSF